MFRIYFLIKLWPVFWICFLKATAESAPLNFATPNSTFGNDLTITNIEKSSNKSHEDGKSIFLSTDFQVAHKNTEEQEKSSRELEKYVSEELKEKNKTPRKKLVECANEQLEMVTDKASDIDQLGTTTYPISNENTIFERRKDTDETMNLKALNEADERRTDISKKPEENLNSTETQFAETYNSKLIVDKAKLSISIENTEEHNLVNTTDDRQPDTSYLNLETEKSGKEAVSSDTAEGFERLSNWIVAQENNAVTAVQTNVVAESKPEKANTNSNIAVTTTVATTITDIDVSTKITPINPTINSITRAKQSSKTEYMLDGLLTENTKQGTIKNDFFNSWGFENNLIIGGSIGKSSILLETAAYCANGVLVGKWCHSSA